MIRKTLRDDAAGNAKGWNPNGALTGFTIQDSDIVDADTSIVTVNLSVGTLNICQALNVGGDQFFLRCNVAPPDTAELQYQIIDMPENVVTSSSSSSILPTASSQDTGLISTQDEYSSEFP